VYVNVDVNVYVDVSVNVDVNVDPVLMVDGSSLTAPR
jgi:hypothetical protein